jgi:hypothetical protein
VQKLIRKKISNNDLKTILTDICQLTNFDYGEIWLPNDKNDLLELSSNYYVMPGNHQYDLELFHECSQGFIMSKGEGLPGRVFFQKEPKRIFFKK